MHISLRSRRIFIVYDEFGEGFCIIVDVKVFVCVRAR